MQLLFATKLLDLASGAVGLVQKAFTHNSSKGGFDAELKDALAGTGKSGKSGKSGLMEMLSQKGILDEDALEGLLGCPCGVVLLQFMTELKNMGINPKDMGFLLSGKGSKISDEALGSLLESNGLGKAEIEKIMTDEAMKTRIKASLAETFKTALQTASKGDGLKAETLVALATADAATIEQLTETSGAALKGSGLTRESSGAREEIRAMIAAALKEPEASGGAGDPAVSAGAKSVEKMVGIVEKTFEIDKPVLKDLFFSTDQAVRDAAVSTVSKQINAYLAAHADEQVAPEVREALSFLRSAMSEQEFSSIDNSLKLWKPDLGIPAARAEMDGNLYTALARQLGSTDAGSLYETQMKQVIDQLRKMLPAQLKNSEGSVTLRLNPPMLGRVDVNMSMNDGQLQASFKTDHSMTRDILLQNMHVLKDALAEQGIRATQFTVTAGIENRPSDSGYAFAGQDRQHHGSGQGGRRSGTLGRAFRDDEEIGYSRGITRGMTAAGALDIIA